MDSDTKKPVRVATKARIPLKVRKRQLAEIRRRLEAGELDSNLALMETAIALLDGDLPRAR